MSTSSNGETPKDSRKIWYGVLTVLLLTTWGYIIYDKSKTKETLVQKDTQILTVSTEKDSIQLAFNNASLKLDSLSSNNTKLQGSLASENDELIKLKSSIGKILTKKNASDAELKQAKDMIAELNGKIDGLSAEIDKLKGENKQLSSANTKLNGEKDSINSVKQKLEQNLSTTQAAKANVEDLASTLHASNIAIIGIDKKSSGKEKVTTTAKRATQLRFTFDLDENMLAPSGTKTIYVCVTGPDGKAISSGETFNSRDEGAKPYTNKTDVQYEQGKRSHVNFDWKKDDGKYQIGDYKVDIYHNGFKIGSGVKTLKKGGLFS